MMAIEYVSDEMRTRLEANRDGRLTSDQWKDMVTAPLTVLLFLMLPVALLLGPRLLPLAGRGIIIALVLALVVIVVPMIFRARRYARAPLQFERFYAGHNPTPLWLFWRPLVLYTADGEPVRFKKRLAPYTLLHSNRSYMVYYLREPDHNVLLSIAPADHPEAEQWQPSVFFNNRQARRAGS